MKRVLLKAACLGFIGVMSNAGMASAASVRPVASMKATCESSVEKQYVSGRPKKADRCFVSPAVEEIIKEVTASINNPKLAWMFQNCFPNTLDTTVDYSEIDGKPDTYVITGDIDAMWLRDSSAQIWPYLSLVDKDEKLKKLFQGLIARQVKCILLDPYANAFFKDETKKTYWKDDKPTPKPGVHERKWEIDSPCYVVRLAYGYWKKTGDASIFDDNWDKAARTIVKTFRTEQRKDGTSPYYFVRLDENNTVTAVFNGKGRPAKPTGLICSAFRPSDDGCMYPYLIPSNLFAVQSLDQLAQIYREVKHDNEFANECGKFSHELQQAIHKYAIANHLSYGRLFAYEVDGYRNKVFIDDPNIPSLIAIKYLIDKKYYPLDVYNNTRKYLLSNDNPYYFYGAAGEGQGGPHAGLNTIWPMGIILRAMTSTNDNEIAFCINQLLKTDNDMGFMHETFNKDDAAVFSRSWFAWANTLFGEMIINLYHNNPELLKSL